MAYISLFIGRLNHSHLLSEITLDILQLYFFIRCKTYVRLYEGVTIWYPHRLNIGNKVTLNEWYILVTLAVYQWEMTAQEVIEFQQYNPIMA